MIDLKMAIGNFSIRKNLKQSCKYITYLNIKDKFTFVDEYRKELEKHKNDYEHMESFIGYVFFNMLIVKYYTDIEFDLTYENYDLLMSSGLFNALIVELADDYTLLLKFSALRLGDGDGA